MEIFETDKDIRIVNAIHKAQKKKQHNKVCVLVLILAERNNIEVSRVFNMLDN